MTYVTSIKFFGDLILAGIGDHLHIFERSKNGVSWNESFSTKVFSGQCIHGINHDNELGVIVFGGSSACLLRFRSFQPLCQLSSICLFKVQDWILDSLWLATGKEIAFLTANNSLCIYNVASDQPDRRSVAVCEDRCIIYSGQLLLSSNNLIVLAGTVFSTIIIWSSAGADQTKESIHRLRGHAGVIFCVQYCSGLRKICSTSDDRSVRIWDVAFSDTNREDWRRCEITLKYTLYGHSARVWKCQFINDGRFISIGEDSRICLWNEDGSLGNQWSGHQNSEIWSLDASNLLEFVATGGSDGGINVWPLKSETVPYQLNYGGAGIPDVPRCVGLLGAGCPFLVTVGGDVFLFVRQMWKHAMAEPSLKSYCVQSVSPDKTHVAFGGISGSVVVCCLTEENLCKIIEARVSKSRIYSLFWLSNDSLIISEEDGVLSVWAYSSKDPSLIKTVDFILPPCKERWITSSAADDKYLVCGDRAGSLFLYAKHDSDKHPIHVAKKVHGCKGVTCVQIVNSKVLSTGRDGKYREFAIENNELLLVTCAKLRVEWAAAILDNPVLRRILICFHEKFLVVWSIDERRPVLKINCGGGHRSWDCSVDIESSNIYFTYIKGKAVFFCKIPVRDVACQTVLHGSTSKAINAATILPKPPSNTAAEEASDQYVLLGSEDTTVRLLSLKGKSHTELSILHNHLSSVRAVHWLKTDDGGDVYVASAGGRGQLVIWKLISCNNSSEIMFLDSYSVLQQNVKTDSASDEPEMRIMSIKICQSGRECLLICAGCSDGTIRTFSFDCAAKSVSPGSVLEKSYCLLELCLVEHMGKLHALTTGTAGLISFNRIHDLKLENGETETNIAISDCGINCCDYKTVDDFLLLLTGGDDAILNVLLLKEENNRWAVKDRRKNHTAHVCQISGVRIVDNWLMSVGLDQRLSIFSWKISQFEVTSTHLMRVDLPIPDIHGILVWRKPDGLSYNLFIYGLGMQLLKFVPSKGRRLI